MERRQPDISGSLRFVRNAGAGIHNYGTMTLYDLRWSAATAKTTDGGGLHSMAAPPP
jgi:hypothetical protein